MAASVIPIDWTKPFILMLQHPVTTSYGEGFNEVSITLEAIREFKELQKIVLWPNADAGSDHVSKGIRVFRERLKEQEKFHFYRNFTPEDYAKVINNAVCLVGNSSSFIREGSFLGKPAVIIGDRQNFREGGNNIATSDYNIDSIIAAIKKQIDSKSYQKERIFGAG